MKKILILYFLLTGSTTVFSQNDIALGTWRSHPSFYKLEGVSLGNNSILAFNEAGMFEFDTSLEGFTKWDKVNNLSRSDISAIHYLAASNTLLVAYSNGEIDLINDEESVNIRSISRSSLAGSKRINQIVVRGAVAYLLADFGVAVLDLNRIEIRESYLNLGENGSSLSVSGGLVFQDSLFLASSRGILAASLLGNQNLQDFNNWKRFGPEQQLPNIAFRQLASIQNELWARSNAGNLYYYELGKWQISGLATQVRGLNQGSNALYLSLNSGLGVYQNGQFQLVNHELITAPVAVLEDNQGKLWIADQQNGLISNWKGNWQIYTPSGPSNNQTHQLRFLQDRMWAMPTPQSINPNTTIQGVAHFSTKGWTRYNQSSLVNLTDVQFYNNQFYFGSMRKGILIQNAEEEFVELITGTPEVSLQSTPEGYVLVSGLSTDAQNNLWVINYQASRPLHRFNSSGWTSFSINTDGSLLGHELVIPYTGHVWMRTNAQFGLGMVVADIQNDTSRLVSSGQANGRLPSARINSIAEDQNSNMWVGTDAGVAYFNSIFNAFRQNIEAIKPIYSRQFLFDGKRVSKVLIDPANRKWFATEDGLFLFNANIDTLLLHFNINNSPLPSNQILSMDLNSQSGELFIGTDKGLISYRDGVTQGSARHQSTVKVFPNPVNPSFKGTVGINGLANNAFVKITDSTGKLVYEIRANGSTATWNLQNLRGQRVSTGMYLVFSSSSDGIETYVAKIAVVN